MKITTAMLISALAVAPATILAQTSNTSTGNGTSSAQSQMTISTATLISALAFDPAPVAVPDSSIAASTAQKTVTSSAAQQKTEAEQFHVDRQAALDTAIESYIGHDELVTLPLKDNNVLSLLGN